MVPFKESFYDGYKRWRTLEAIKLYGIGKWCDMGGVVLKVIKVQ